MEELKIIPGGNLIRTRWVYDEEKDKGAYLTEDVTEHAPLYLFDACSLDDTVILKDIFILLNRHIDVYKSIFRTYVEEI